MRAICILERQNEFLLHSNFEQMLSRGADFCYHPKPGNVDETVSSCLRF